jgi:hypothetical protein
MDKVSNKCKLFESCYMVHTSANITKTLFAEKHDNRSPPSAPSSAPTRHIAPSTLVNQSKTRSRRKMIGTIATKVLGMARSSRQ